jgi:hypothetical protein
MAETGPQQRITIPGEPSGTAQALVASPQKRGLCEPLHMHRYIGKKQLNIGLRSKPFSPHAFLPLNGLEPHGRNWPAATRREVSVNRCTCIDTLEKRRVLPSNSYSLLRASFCLMPVPCHSALQECFLARARCSDVAKGRVEWRGIYTVTAQLSHARESIPGEPSGTAQALVASPQKRGLCEPLHMHR